MPVISDPIAASGPMDRSILSLRRIGHGYDRHDIALGPIDLTIEHGEFLSLVGPSGCGKSTLLRILAGLISPSTGTIDRTREGPAAFVFQEPALLPWRDVQRNAELLMELERVDPVIRFREARRAIRTVGLDGFESFYPHQLSGGMRMRLSLARALALAPGMLLLDEPLSAVDEQGRDALQEELSRLWTKGDFAAVLVTHSVEEAVFLSTRVAVMSARPGRIVNLIDVPFVFPRTEALRDAAEFVALCQRVKAMLRGKG